MTQVQSLMDSDQLIPVDIAQLISPSWILRPLSEEIVVELQRSIRNTGLLQPIVVRRSGEKYEVVFGNHRLEACKRLGIKKVRAIVRTFTDEEAFLARVSENLLRNSYVNPIEEAQGYQMLLNRGWTINAIGQRVGKCDSYVCERISILERLSGDLRKQVSDEKLTASHAELISRIKDKQRQKVVADLVRKKRLSVRSLEDMLNGFPPPTKVKVETLADQCRVRIPKEFADAVGMEDGLTMFLYVRGGKLILESAKRSRCEMKSSGLNLLLNEVPRYGHRA